MTKCQSVVRLANRIQRIIDGERRCTYSIADLMQAVGIIAYGYGREDADTDHAKKNSRTKKNKRPHSGMRRR
ncbi:MAG TPA: hypothetical protein VJO35_18760 [Terriglobales bacterium]|nr:hypothetical protein [Terriglobales bacterium]